MKLMGHSSAPSRRNKERRHEKLDVIVIGSGAAGFAAAVTASRKGLSVLMLEKSPAVWRHLRHFRRRGVDPR